MGFQYQANLVKLPESKLNIKVGYALFPIFDSDKTSGTLEDLCLCTLFHQASAMSLKVVDDAVTKVEKDGEKLRRPHKNKLHTYLSLTNDFVGLKIGESAKANAFCFSAREFEPLKTLLNEMLKE